MDITQISPAELNGQLKTGARPVLLDVREDAEVAAGAIPGITHIPLDTLPGRLSELDKDAEIVCICKGGVRSMKAAETLVASGFTNVKNMTGGVMAWKSAVDPAFVVG